MTRSVPEGLAPILERLELDQPSLVTLQQLTEIAAEIQMIEPMAPSQP